MNSQSIWDSAYHQLELQLDRATFDTWVRGASLLRVEEAESVFVIGVKNNYALDMLQHRLYRNLRRVVGDVAGRVIELRFEVTKASSAAKPITADMDMPLLRLLAQSEALAKNDTPSTGMILSDHSANPANGRYELPPSPLHQYVARPQRPELPESDLNPRFTLDRFMAGTENAMVYAAARAVVESPVGAYNPFFIHGDVGLGKTHLLQAIANAGKGRNLRVIYIPSEVFTNDLIDSIRQRTTAMFRERYRSADVLVIDDIQFISGKESTQEEFFHTFNSLYTFGKQIVIASDRPPRDLGTLEARLRSRFEGGLVVDLQPPEFETRVAILKQWTTDRHIRMTPRVLEVIAAKTKTNVRELEGVFNQMLATMHLSGEPMTEEVASDILDGFRRPRYGVTITRVLEMTARSHGLTVTDLIGPRRSGPINQARQIAMYLARELTNTSLPQIGAAFGGRKHSTVLHACHSVADDLQYDDALNAVVNALRDTLLGSTGYDD